MSSSAALDADASRPRSGILTPSSEGSLNRHDVPLSSDTRKRKRADSIALEHLLKPSIAIKPHPPNLQAQPRILLPLMLLPRKYLPLAYIDFAAGTSDYSGRIVESHIKILDLESRVGSASSVLIARYDPRGIIYALERQEHGLYIVCQLGAWVDLQDLKQHATAVYPDRIQHIKLECSERPVSAAAITTPQIHKEHNKKQAAIEALQSLVKKRARSESISIFNEPARLQNIPDVKEASVKLPSLDLGDVKGIQQPLAQPSQHIEPDTKLELPPEEPQYTAESIFDNIRTQYFEALYKSMGSLAYFAKGPLSRARSAFHLDLEANLNMTDLVDFLKSLVLTTVQIDQKYRQAVPDIITNIKAIVESSDEGRRRKRKPKKMKLGRDGLYPLEDEHIRAWWTANQPEVKDGEAGITPGLIRSHTTLLRTRETQLQMILILEILALEPLKAVDEASEANLPTLPGTEEFQDSPNSGPAITKRRNKHNLPVLLDVHADRLTIWQSIASDEQLILEDSQALNASFNGQMQQKASSEPLRDFCVDVIVPFFSARLPTICDSINRKLGGPTIAPPKSKSRSRQSSKRDQKPGTVTKRLPAPNAPRTLQRALSTEQQHRRSVSRGPSNMIALMRSATSTTIPSFKREGSESISTRATPFTEQRDITARDMLARSSSMVSLDDAKARKKALLEAELKDAISALRKPNRDVVGKALAEAAERRATTSTSAKKTKKPARAATSAIQVKATPANKRFKDVLGMSTGVAGNAFVSMEELIPPSSISTLIPSTAPRPGHWDAMVRDGSPSRDAVASTPMKPLRHSEFPEQSRSIEPAIPLSSPAMERHRASPSQLSDTPAALPPLRRLDFTASRSAVVYEDSVKDATMEQGLGEAKTHSKSSEGLVSIYQQLGWDDEMDDFL
ncbi:hypothetical protein HJFPF1_03138 [Paramyrothecium foliicola]|nr:hypothetical protein HJFPF1_03138 [Paramyrothecium foliicola]